MITHTNDYVLVVEGDTVDKIEVFTIEVKNFPSSTDSDSTSSTLALNTIPCLDKLTKYISLTGQQTLKVNITNFPMLDDKADTSNFAIYIYGVIPGTT